MLLSSFKLNFVLPVNVFAPGLRAGSGWSPAPLLPFFQIVVRSSYSVGLRSCHSSKPGSARRLCGCPLPLGFARRRCGRPLPPSSARRQCSCPLPLSSAKPMCTSARGPYIAMAPPSTANSYYCELCDRTLVPSANLEEHKVGAIHRGLLEASRKMTTCQLQVFRKDLKVGHRKPKLLAKRAILEALREPVEPSKWNTGLKQTVHWGPLKNAWILRHFRQKGIDIPDVLKDVVRFGCETTQKLRMKERNATLDSFWELLTDCVLIYKGAVVAILLHKFVPSDQAVEHFAAMAHMWEFGGRVIRTCSPEIRMAMFGHRFCYNDCVPTRIFQNQRSKESLLAHTTEDLEAYANAWADKFVDTN